MLLTLLFLNFWSWTYLFKWNTNVETWTNKTYKSGDPLTEMLPTPIFPLWVLLEGFRNPWEPPQNTFWSAVPSTNVIGKKNNYKAQITENERNGSSLIHLLYFLNHLLFNIEIDIKHLLVKCKVPVSPSSL